MNTFRNTRKDKKLSTKKNNTNVNLHMDEQRDEHSNELGLCASSTRQSNQWVTFTPSKCLSINATFSLTQYKSYPMFVPSIKVPGPVVPEKSLKKKMLIIESH